MKKLFFVVALLAVVASCTKNEVIPQNDGNKEITYLTAPLTKATFETSNRFYSYAYLLTEGKNWASKADESTLYINEAEISYQTDKWKPTPPTTSYYWPKDAGSSLTFFAWSNGTATLNPAVGECSNEHGVQFPNYNVSTYKNKDMMVAKIVADQKANTKPGTYGASEGVPTLFYHVLSSLEINAKVKEAYTGVTFKVKEITLLNNLVEGSYAQGVDAGVGVYPTAGTWTPASPSSTTIANLPVYTHAGFILTTAEQPLAASGADYRILLPHDFADTELMEITYDIVTTYTGSAVTETVTDSKKLSEIFGTSWEAGKKYTLTITLGMNNEILWDPAVQVWDNTGSGSWSM